MTRLCLCALGLLVAGFAHAQPIVAGRTQVYFSKPAGMKIYWLTRTNGKTVFSNVPLETPGRFNFVHGATYQLKLTHVPRHAGLELYPTLEVVRPNPRTAEFLAHNSIPIRLSEDDFKEVAERNNYIVKAVYLPSARFQDGAGIDEVASTRLEPGQDPVRKAGRRGEVLLILRMGNIRKKE